MYGDAFLDRAIAAHGRSDADLMATLTEFTAGSIALAVRQLVPKGGVDEIIVAGGVARNPALLERIEVNASPIPVRLSDELGIPITARETRNFTARDPGQMVLRLILKRTRARHE